MGAQLSTEPRGLWKGDILLQLPQTAAAAAVESCRTGAPGRRAACGNMGRYEWNQSVSSFLRGLGRTVLGSPANFRWLGGGAYIAPSHPLSNFRTNRWGEEREAAIESSQ